MTTEPRCYHCQTLLPDINAACPNCLPNFYSSQVPPRQAPPSSKEQALGQWLKTCQWGDLKDAFYAGWEARRPVQTEVCPVCRTVHDKPLCPAPTLQAPIANIIVDDNGEVSAACMYAPGLPAGSHDVYCEPPAPGGQKVPHPCFAPETKALHMGLTSEQLAHVDGRCRHGTWPAEPCEKCIAEKTGDDGLCWIKGCQRLRGHEGFCDPLPAPDVSGKP